MSKKVETKPKHEAVGVATADKPEIAFENKTQTQIVDYTPTSELPAYSNLIEAINKTLVIVDVEWRDTQRGRVYYIHSENMGSYYTWSKVIGKQLEDIKANYLEKGFKVRAKVVKRKNYLTLTKPD